MQDILNEARFSILSQPDKDFIRAFDARMKKLGYDYGDNIGSGYCWGRYMLIYSRSAVKNKKVVARIYIRDNGITLRLFLSNIDKHRAFIEGAPSHVKDVFVGDKGNCGHCGNDKGGRCMFRKTYTIDNRLIEKCNGKTFEFHGPGIDGIDDYMGLFNEFYPWQRRRSRA